MTPATDRAAGQAGTVGDGFRLAVGTLTVFPVRPPRVVDRSSGAWAMTFAPLVGVLLAGVAALVLWLLGSPLFGWVSPLYEIADRQDLVTVRPAAPVLAAALTVGLLALVTRGLHLDGLADTVDGLGSGRPAEQALAIMRRSDIGPFGVVALVLMLLLQVFALAQHIAAGRGTFALTLALVLSRLVLPGVCSRGVPAARRDGLGRAVAGSVSRGQLLLALAFSVAVVAATATAATAAAPDHLLATGPLPGTGIAAGIVAGIVAGAALLAGAAICLWSVRRLGGVTGDVMGACVEVTFTVALVVHTML